MRRKGKGTHSTNKASKSNNIHMVLTRPNPDSYTHFLVHSNKILVFSYHHRNFIVKVEISHPIIVYLLIDNCLES